MEACIECDRVAGDARLEAVAENKNALALYESGGFEEYGRNSRGFRSRLSGWQELVLMRLELEGQPTAKRPVLYILGRDESAAESEHWFHTGEQIRFLDGWITSRENEAPRPF